MPLPAFLPTTRTCHVVLAENISTMREMQYYVMLPVPFLVLFMSSYLCMPSVLFSLREESVWFFHDLMDMTSPSISHQFYQLFYKVSVLSVSICCCATPFYACLSCVPASLYPSSHHLSSLLPPILSVFYALAYSSLLTFPSHPTFILVHLFLLLSLSLLPFSG